MNVLRFGSLVLSMPALLRSPFRSQPLSSFYTLKRPGAGGMKRRNPGDPKTRWKRIPIDANKNTMSKKPKGPGPSPSSAESSSSSSTSSKAPSPAVPPPPLSSPRIGSSSSSSSKRWQMKQDSDMYVKAVRSNRNRLNNSPALSPQSPSDSATTRAYKLHKAKTATFVHALSRASFKLEDIERNCFPPAGGLLADNNAKIQKDDDDAAAVVVLDLGASPGGWSDYVLWRFSHPSVAAEPAAKAGGKRSAGSSSSSSSSSPPPSPTSPGVVRRRRCLLLSCDLNPFPPPPNANPRVLRADPGGKPPDWQLVVGDFSSEAIQRDLKRRIDAFVSGDSEPSPSSLPSSSSSSPSSSSPPSSSSSSPVSGGARRRPSLPGSVNLVLSDMASNTTGDSFTDVHRTNGLLRSAWDFVSGGGAGAGAGAVGGEGRDNKNNDYSKKPLLKKGGAFVGKFFIGGDEDADIVKLFRTCGRWKTVRVFKPDASRKESKEAFLVARGFKG